MWIILTLFILGLLGTFAMLTFRAWKIETGLVEYKERGGYVELVPHGSVVSFRKSVVYYTRWIGHVIIMLVIRAWVFSSHAIAKTWYARFPKKEKPVGETSHFLRSVSEYKHRVKKLREKLQEREEAKKEESTGEDQQ